MSINPRQPLLGGLEYDVAARTPGGTWLTFLTGGSVPQAMQCLALALVDSSEDAILVECFDPLAREGGCGRGG